MQSLFGAVGRFGGLDILTVDAIIEEGTGKELILEAAWTDHVISRIAIVVPSFWLTSFMVRIL